MKNHNVFQNKTLNRFIKTSSLFVIRLYTIISIAILAYGVYAFSDQRLHGLIYLFAGLFTFTFIEYIFHRFIYHSGPNYMDEKTWQYKAHGIHHDLPNDTEILAMPLPLGLLLAGLFFALYYWIFGIYAYFFFPGFFIGYAAYLYVHYKIHTSKPPKNALKYLWVHHHKHHHVSGDKAYGVSSPLWDVIFFTMPPSGNTAKK